MEFNDTERISMVERIESLCQGIVETARDCENGEHLTRIFFGLECVFMAGHEDVEYDDEEVDRRPDA
jgi:hypothetical protein